MYKIHFALYSNPKETQSKIKQHIDMRFNMSVFGVRVLCETM